MPPLVLILPPVLGSVTEARAAVKRVAREWQCTEDVVHDARVVVSELMSNGVLHARTELRVVVGLLPHGALRVEVHDASPAPLLPQPEVRQPDNTLLDEPPLAQVGKNGAFVPSTTGRGLPVVRALASSWGWSRDPGGGKVVWADVGRPSAPEDAPDAGSAPERANQLRPVRLVALPVRLLKASEDHFDELFRELQMASLGAQDAGGHRDGPARRGAQVARALGPAAEEAKNRLTGIRAPLRRAVWEASLRGDRVVDLDLLMDADLSDAFALAAQLVSDAGQAAVDGFLLTEPPSEEVASWREWLRFELADQLAGRPPIACPFPVSATPAGAGVNEVADELGAAQRGAVTELRSVLDSQRRQGDFVGAGNAEDPAAEAALQLIIDYVGARRATICLLGPDNETVLLGASVGFSDAVSVFWRNFSLSADLPASECIRTGRPSFFRTFAELDERYPIFLSTPAESDPSIACVPIVGEAAAPVVGCLTIGFGKARDFSTGDMAFLEKLASEIGRFIADARRVEAAQMASRLSRDVEVACDEIRACQSGDDALHRLADAAVKLLADAAAVRIFENDVLRVVAARHRDPKREELVVALLQDRQDRESTNTLPYQSARSGEAIVVQTVTETSLAGAARDSHELGVLQSLSIGSVAVLPLKAAERVVGTLDLAHEVGKFVTEAEVAAAQRLVDAAGEVVGWLGTDPG